MWFWLCKGASVCVCFNNASCWCAHLDLIPFSSQAASHLIWRWYIERKRTSLYRKSVSFPCLSKFSWYTGIVLQKSIQQNLMYWLLEHGDIEGVQRSPHFPSAQSLQSNLSDIDLYSIYHCWAGSIVSRQIWKWMVGCKLQGWFYWCNILYLFYSNMTVFPWRVLRSHVAFALGNLVHIGRVQTFTSFTYIAHHSTAAARPARSFSVQERPNAYCAVTSSSNKMNI